MRMDLLRAYLVLLALALLGVSLLGIALSSLHLYLSVWASLRGLLLAYGALIALLGVFFLLASIYAFKVKSPRSHRIIKSALKFLVSIQVILIAISLIASPVLALVGLFSKGEIASLTLALLLYLNWRRSDVRRLYGIVVEEIPETLSDEIELLNYIKERGGVYRRSEAARALGISLARVLRAERSLAEDGFIVYL